MGITGLLKSLEPITRETSLSELAGNRVAVDGYIWLHRSVHHCSRDLCKGIVNRSYVAYFINRVIQLQRHSLDVTIVFDGAPLCAKNMVELDRAKLRQESIEIAEAYDAKGMFTEANAHYAKAVDVTPQLAYEVCVALKSHEPKVKIIVAPYEADAQLAYLCQSRLVDFVISEDSDLLVYGCAKVLYKLDFKTETGRMISLADIFTPPSCFSRLSFPTFQIAAVLSGCDYLSNLPGIGIKSAISIAVRCETLRINFPAEFENIASDSFLARLVVFVKLSGADFLPEDYLDCFKKAILTFSHQVVFDSVHKCLVPLSPIDPPFVFAGTVYDPLLACGVADCLLHPETKEPFQSVCSKKSQGPKKVITKKKSSALFDGMPTLMACWAFRMLIRRAFSTNLPPPPKNNGWLSQVKHGWTWIRTTAKEKGKPFIAWYATLYLGGLLTAYGAVRIHNGVEPELVKSWAYKLHADKLVDIESIEMSKKNCEYLAALLLNEAVDTPRLILAVLTIDRVILLARKVLK